VVVEPHEDFDIGATGEAPVGEVGLPALVGKVGLEADVGRFRSLLGVRGDLAGCGEVAVDRRGRDRCLVVVFEVPRDCVASGVEAVGAELASKPQDQRHQLGA